MLDIYIYFRAWIPYHYDTVLDLLNNWDDRVPGVGSSRVAGSVESVMPMSGASGRVAVEIW